MVRTFHLQALSTPMIRVDGKPHFLSSPPLTDAQVKEFVDELIRDPLKREMFEKDGAVDLAFSMPDKSARFRTNVFHSRERFAIAMRRIVSKIPNFEELALPPQVEKLADHHARYLSKRQNRERRPPSPLPCAPPTPGIWSSLPFTRPTPP